MRFVKKIPKHSVYKGVRGGYENIPPADFQGKLECPSRICRLVNYTNFGVNFFMNHWVRKDGTIVEEAINDSF